MNVFVGAPPGQCATSDTLTDRVRRVQRSARTLQNDTASRLAGQRFDHRIKAARVESESECAATRRFFCWRGGWLVDGVGCRGGVVSAETAALSTLSGCF